MTKPDKIVEKQLEKTAHLPQFTKEMHNGRVVKFRHCRLCGRKLENGEPYQQHVRHHW